MRLQLNGVSIEFEGETLSEVLIAQGFGEAKVATAVNGAFVPTALRGEFGLKAGDMIEVLAPMQGG
jgi:sulfur carrier protein